MKVLPKNYTEERLIRELKQCDQSAFRILYRQYAPIISGVINRIIRDHAVSEDAVQETFIKVFERIQLYDTSKGRLCTWLINVARNTAIDELRKIKKRGHIGIDDTNTLEIDVHYQTYLPNADFLDIPALINTLNPTKKAVIDLVYLNGYTTAEAAKKLSIPEGTVKTRVRSALKSLRYTAAINAVD